MINSLVFISQYYNIAGVGEKQQRCPREEAAGKYKNSCSHSLGTYRLPWKDGSPAALCPLLRGDRWSTHLAAAAPLRCTSPDDSVMAALTNLALHSRASTDVLSFSPVVWRPSTLLRDTHSSALCYILLFDGISPILALKNPQCTDSQLDFSAVWKNSVILHTCTKKYSLINVSNNQGYQ